MLIRVLDEDSVTFMDEGEESEDEYVEGDEDSNGNLILFSLI
jgi:hypothetical protein